jgi:hypothetical protein
VHDVEPLRQKMPPQTRGKRGLGFRIRRRSSRDPDHSDTVLVQRARRGCAGEYRDTVSPSRVRAGELVEVPLSAPSNFRPGMSVCQCNPHNSVSVWHDHGDVLKHFATKLRD